ncbi:type II toxin-antitoxin system RelE/ParE family toxin [Gryllotalpicola koreensis]|uniref:Toxin n=1 Tax=Gryllotalpicola koreensis TaxID=993086 RepID=A0ABP7ZRC4_9MICO
MSGYRLTPAAQRDLSSIWDYTEDAWGPQQAETYLGEIRFAFERIAANPERGRACDDIRAGYRRYAIGSHILFYIVAEDGQVDIVRVLHQRMDPTRHM